MAKKRAGKSRPKSSKIKIKDIETPIEKQIEKFGKDVAKGSQDVEKWMIERRKFLIKLAWVVGLVLALLIVSYLFLGLK